MLATDPKSFKARFKKKTYIMHKKIQHNRKYLVFSEYHILVLTFQQKRQQEVSKMASHKIINNKKNSFQHL